MRLFTTINDMVLYDNQIVSVDVAKLIIGQHEQLIFWGEDIGQVISSEEALELIKDEDHLKLVLGTPANISLTDQATGNSIGTCGYVGVDLHHIN